VTSLQPLSQLGEAMQDLRVVGCYKVQELALGLPHLKPTAYVSFFNSGVQEVAVAGMLV
jgi:hypothetical protein